MGKRLAHRDTSVVAIKTGALDKGMVNPLSRLPGGCGMASVTIRRRRDMCLGFSTGHPPIVAINAQTQHVLMINAQGRQPPLRRMTRFADCARVYMRRLFTAGDTTVMTNTAGAAEFIVVHHPNGCPRCNIMAR